MVFKEDSKEVEKLEENVEQEFRIEGKKVNVEPMSSGISTHYAVFTTGTDAVNVRNGPGINHALVRQIPVGEIVEGFPANTGYDRAPVTWNAGFGWMRLRGTDQWVAGWMGTSFANSNGRNLWAAHARPFQGHITGAVNIRRGPGTEFALGQIGNLSQLPPNSRINVTHLVSRASLPWSHSIPTGDPTQAWLRIERVITSAGVVIDGTAWVRADMVSNRPANLIPVSEPRLGPLQRSEERRVVISPFLNHRSGPGTHHSSTGQSLIGDIITTSQSRKNLTEDRLWIRSGNAWLAAENTAVIEQYNGRNFHVSTGGINANIRNAPATAGTSIVTTVPHGTVLRTTDRRVVQGGMNWYRFEMINGRAQVGWIADVNGFIEGNVGAPGTPMPPQPSAGHHFDWIDSRAVSLRNPDYVRNSTIHEQRPFFFPSRNRNNLNRIIIHHTANPTPVTRRDIEVHWRNIGWWNGGYHEMIYRDGRVDVCYFPEVETNGASGHNSDTYHIAYVGLGNPTDAQRAAMIRRVSFWQDNLNPTRRIPIGGVFGHNELPGSATECPGISMVNFRSTLGGNSNIDPQLEPGVIFRNIVNQTYRELAEFLRPFHPPGTSIGGGVLTAPTLPNFVTGPTVYKLKTPDFEFKVQALGTIDVKSNTSLNFSGGKLTANHNAEITNNLNIVSSFGFGRKGITDFSMGLAGIIQTGSVTTSAVHKPLPRGMQSTLTVKYNVFKDKVIDGLDVKFCLKFEYVVRIEEDDQQLCFQEAYAWLRSVFQGALLALGITILIKLSKGFAGPALLPQLKAALMDLGISF